MRTGFIGLGAMGLPMAMNLHRAGTLHRAWNRSPEPARRLAQATGVTLAADPGALAADCELVLSCVSRDQDLLEVMAPVLAQACPGSVVVDCSTVSPTTVRHLAARFAERDVAFLDAPVSGGVEGARRGTLSMMVGGREPILELVRPVLEAVAARITHLGPSGAGQATKAVNQVMAAGINQAVTDALALGHAMGLPMDRVIEVIGSGAAGNWFLSHRGASMLANHFEPGFRVDLHHKDLAICQAMQRETGLPALDSIDRTLADYRELMERGHGDEDISALFRLKRRPA